VGSIPAAIYVTAVAGRRGQRRAGAVGVAPWPCRAVVRGPNFPRSARNGSPMAAGNRSVRANGGVPSVNDGTRASVYRRAARCQFRVSKLCSRRLAFLGRVTTPMDFNVGRQRHADIGHANRPPRAGTNLGSRVHWDGTFSIANVRPAVIRCALEAQ